MDELFAGKYRELDGWRREARVSGEQVCQPKLVKALNPGTPTCHHPKTKAIRTVESLLSKIIGRVSIYLSIYLSIYIYIYVHVYIYICVYNEYTYIYICMNINMNDYEARKTKAHAAYMKLQNLRRSSLCWKAKALLFQSYILSVLI